MNASKNKAAFLIIVGLCLSFVATDLHAQRFGRRGGSRFFSTGPISLLASRYVQAELELSEDQAELIFALRDDLFNEYRNARPPRAGRGDAPNSSSGQYLSESEIIEKTSAVANRLIDTILEPKQLKRFTELQLQREGLRAIGRDDMATALELSEDQRAKVKELLAGLSRGYGRGPISDEDAEVAKSVTEVLESEQQDRWEKMLGKEFNFRTR